MTSNDENKKNHMDNDDSQYKKICKACCEGQHRCKEGCTLPQDNGVCEVGPQTPLQRRNTAFAIRQNAAILNRDLPLANHPCNNDENCYANKIGNYSKGLPHNELGEVDIAAYNKLIDALSTGNPSKFEQIPLGGTLKLQDPQAAYAYVFEAQDSHQPRIPAPPALRSAQAAGEMVELYWQALTRDVPFIEYDTNPLIKQASIELSKLSDFIGPKEKGKVTPNTIFRGNAPGTLVGPYVSQFLLQNVPYGATPFNQKIQTVTPGTDFLTQYSEWLNVQNGASTPPLVPNTTNYIRDGRDLALYVHVDFSLMEQLNAGLILLGYGSQALASSNPYLKSKTQSGFVTFASPHILDFATKVARLALAAAWFQKWLVSRRLRPEEFGGLVQNTKTGATNYPINPELLCSQAVKETYKKYGSYLLPQAYPEGCPAHPSYPAGHATWMGAGVTVLKAFFNEDFVIPNPVQASADGSSLIPYTGPPLTVGGELNKLAYNIAIGRDWAGIHYRSDGVEGIKLGEEIAIDFLQNYCPTYNEPFKGYELTTFDGTKLTIGCKGCNCD